MAKATYNMHLDLDLIVTLEGEAEEMQSFDFMLHVMEGWLDNLLVNWARSRPEVDIKIANLKIS